jgi:hypothetical protein
MSTTLLRLVNRGAPAVAAKKNRDTAHPGQSRLTLQVEIVLPAVGQARAMAL